MAGMEFIDRALRPLEEQALEFELLFRTFESLAGDDPPAWHSLLWPRVLDLNNAIHAYVDAVHEHARPLLADMARLSKT